MAENAQRLVLVRHGETAWSAAGRHTGRTDVALDDAGRAQARALSWLASETFALVLTSPLVRARETASGAGFPDAVVDPDLCEWDYGEYEGLTTASIRERTPGWTIWAGDPPAGESIGQVATRAGRVLTRATSAEGAVLIFAHAHLLRVLVACWLGLLPASGSSFALDPASVSELGYERETRVVRSWNVTGTVPA